MIEIPGLKLSKKVKSMQMFHEPVERAAQGDRLGICVTQFDPSLVERCIVSCPGYLHATYGWLVGFKNAGVVINIIVYCVLSCSDESF